MSSDKKFEVFVRGIIIVCCVGAITFLELQALQLGYNGHLLLTVIFALVILGLWELKSLLPFFKKKNKIEISSEDLNIILKRKEGDKK